ncbi:glycosyltransferase [Corynebacterium jeikeium]|uniref:glycosyltransferase n=1 Tax=Corynebacterium macclintockiae TaxID=2913501 RepID=UPI00068EBEB8
MTTGRTLKALHVTECFAGGVKTALEGYAALDLPVEHHIIQSARRHPDKLTSPNPDLFNTISELPYGHVAAVKATVEAIREVQPDVVHAHSSFGGVYGRLAAKLTKTPVVYTPHGLSFERRDISETKRFVFKQIERAFSPLSTIQAGCASYEAKLLESLNPRSTVEVVPNAIANSESFTNSRFLSESASAQRSLSFIGRITEARHPEMAMEIAEIAAKKGFTCQWIGDGDADMKQSLENSGIHVTGWLTKAEMAGALENISFVIHTARWDGFPMVILEMLDARKLLLVEDIPALFECPREARFESAEEAVKKLELLLEGSLKPDWSPVTDLYNQRTQANRLLRCYQAAAGIE